MRGLTSSRRRFLGGLVAGGAAMAAFPRHARAATTLQYANASNAQNITNQFVTRFAKAVADATGGEVKTDFLLNMGSEQSIIEGLSLGTLDMAMTGYTGMPEFDVFYTPFLLRDLPHGVKVFEGPLGRKAQDAMLAKLKLRLVGVGSTGPFELRGPPGRAALPPATRDHDAAARLWAMAEDWVGLPFRP